MIQRVTKSFSVFFDISMRGGVTKSGIMARPSPGIARTSVMYFINLSLYTLGRREVVAKNLIFAFNLANPILFLFLNLKR